MMKKKETRFLTLKNSIWVKKKFLKLMGRYVMIFISWNFAFKVQQMNNNSFVFLNVQDIILLNANLY